MSKQKELPRAPQSSPELPEAPLGFSARRKSSPKLLWASPRAARAPRRIEELSSAPKRFPTIYRALQTPPTLQRASSRMTLELKNASYRADG
ncbi:hypothetical protein VTO73DRAFT_6208 [Trametes versicolor]